MPRQIHQVAPEAVYGRLGSAPAGLSPRQVAERQKELGPNRLAVTRRYWWLPILGRQFINFFAILLDLSAAICFVAEAIQPEEGMVLLGWALLGVSVLNALFGFVQEFRAEKAMEELKKFLPQQVLVQRGGEEREVLAESLVPGDVLIVRAGDKLPADARLVESEALLINKAPLTGESKGVELSPAAAEGRLIDSPNVLFAGCTVLRGSGTAIVFATGLRTEFGRIAALSGGMPRKATPLELETAHMVRVLTVIAVAMGLIFFAYGVYAGRSLWTNLVFMMGIIVANVPEGLLPTFTLSLALASQRMARRKVLIKSLNAVETLGSVHVICTDKTGTLTENRLAVHLLVAPLTGEPLDDTHGEQLLCKALVTHELEETSRGLSGDPMDLCIAAACEAETVAEVMQAVQRHFPFDAERRTAAGVASLDGSHFYAVKGAWEAIRPSVTHVASGGKRLAAGKRRLQQADAVVQQMAGEGLRLLAVASRKLRKSELDGEREALEQGLTLAGFLAVADPLRPEVPGAVAKCHAAGIRVLMITGDDPGTARYIALEAGLLAGDAEPEADTLIGDELAEMRQAELIRRLKEGCTVFARTTPEQKMKIVSALHAMERVVAVTGDGVNDTPALKAADVGIAMGASGTDVAREAAEVILLDDNFASIVAGIEEGRTIFANIRKFTNYVLVSNGPEILPYLLYILFPVPLALTVIQILSIDLGTDILPSIALGREPPDRDVMSQPPRGKGKEQALLNKRLVIHSYLFLGLIEACFALSLFFWVLFSGGWEYGTPLPDDSALYHSATGITLSAIILMQIGNLVGRRSQYGSGLDMGLFTNRLIIAAIVLQVFFSWAMLYWQPLATVLGTGPVDPSVYAFAWLGIPLIFGADYIRKRIAFAMAQNRKSV